MLQTEQALFANIAMNSKGFIPEEGYCESVANLTDLTMCYLKDTFDMEISEVGDMLPLPLLAGALGAGYFSNKGDGEEYRKWMENNTLRMKEEVLSQDELYHAFRYGYEAS